MYGPDTVKAGAVRG